MDYDKFKKELEEYNDWNRMGYHDSYKKQKAKVNYFPRLTQLEGSHATNDAWLNLGQSDSVNSPAHYTRGTQEAIDIIEEAIQDAPDVKSGMLQAQALKYLLRLWLKDNSKQDAEKARWYLNRLIDSL